MSTATYSQYIRRYIELGFSLIPVGKDKRPIISAWEPYQTRRCSEQEITNWFRDENDGVAVVCGAVSDDLIAIDFDDKEGFKKWAEVMQQTKYKELAPILDNTVLQKTAKGFHLLVKHKTTKEDFKYNHIFDGEVRGEGHYIVLTPSRHPSGIRYSFADKHSVFDIEPQRMSNENFALLLDSLGATPGQPSAAVDATGIDPVANPEPQIYRWVELLLAHHEVVKDLTDSATIDLIVAPYLVNIRKLTDAQARAEILEFVEKCRGIYSDMQAMEKIAHAKQEGLRPIAYKNLQDTAHFDFTQLDKIVSEDKIGRALTPGFEGRILASAPIEDLLLPQEGRLISGFAGQLGAYFGNETEIFYRPVEDQVVKITKESVSMITKEKRVLIFRAVKDKEFITLVETHFKTGINKDKIGFVEKSMTPNAAAITLEARTQFKEKLPVIERIFNVPAPYLIEGDLVFPRKGYDRTLNSWMPSDAPDVRLNMPLAEAKELIFKIFKEFCFTTGQDKTNAIAALLTPYCRGLYTNNTERTPLFFYKANRERAGKDYCAGITGIIYEGEAIENSPIATGERETHDEEFGKTLTATFKEGRCRVHSSNNKGYLNSSQLESILTKKYYTARQLGSNLMLTFPNTLELSLSANTGIGYTADLAARSVFINLFFSQEDPNARKFETPNLHEWIRGNRGEILSALYALIKDWNEKGRTQGTVTFTTYPEWANIVGGIMENAGLGNPCTPNDTADSIGGDRNTREMKVLFELCYERWPETWIYKKQVMDELQIDDGDFSGLFSWLDWSNDAKSARTRFGSLLDKFKLREFSGIRLEVAEDNTHSTRNQYKWAKGTKNEVKAQNTQKVLENKGKVDTVATMDTMCNPPHCETIKNIYSVEGAQRSQHSQNPPQAAAGVGNPKDLNAEGICPVCGKPGHIWEYGGSWYCTDCLNAKQHSNDGEIE